MYGTVCVYNLKGPKVIQQYLFPIDLNAFSCNLQGGLYCVESKFYSMLFYEPCHKIKENLLFCICENKGTDHQRHGNRNRAAHQDNMSV